MYLLVSMLQKTIDSQSTPRKSNIRTLRNGLVHSFVAVNPQYVKEYIDDQLSPSPQTINQSNLFKSLRGRSKVNKSINADREKLLVGPFCKESLDQATISFIESRKTEMHTQLQRMNSFYLNNPDSLSPVQTHAILYSAGCFCEAADHISYLLHQKTIREKGQNKMIEFPDLQDNIRGMLTHFDDQALSKTGQIVDVINQHKKAFSINYEDRLNITGTKSKVEPQPEKKAAPVKIHADRELNKPKEKIAPDKISNRGKAKWTQQIDIKEKPKKRKKKKRKSAHKHMDDNNSSSFAEKERSKKRRRKAQNITP